MFCPLFTSHSSLFFYLFCSSLSSSTVFSLSRGFWSQGVWYFKKSRCISTFSTRAAAHWLKITCGSSFEARKAPVPTHMPHAACHTAHSVEKSNCYASPVQAVRLGQLVLRVRFIRRGTVTRSANGLIAVYEILMPNYAQLADAKR